METFGDRPAHLQYHSIYILILAETFPNHHMPSGNGYNKANSSLLENSYKETVSRTHDKLVE